MGNKNISKIFAGGNHSWVVLDTLVPVRDKWSIPSPLKSQNNLDNSMNTTTPNKAQRDFSNSAMKSGPFQNTSGNKAYGKNSNNLSPFPN